VVLRFQSPEVEERWFVPLKAVTLTPIKYPANSFWSVGGHNSYGIVAAFLWISLYQEAQNYTAGQCCRTIPTLGPQEGVRNIP